MNYRPLLAGASALALVWSGAAAAQTATPETQDAPAQANASNTEDGEIVVTAQRRNENLMTTAVSASVLSGTQLDNKGVANVDALQFAMPSVVVNNFGQGNDFNVRGIGKAEHNTQTTTGVITYRDGVPTFPGYVQGEPYYDVANIQVLRGPQGTIVGQNATGGAVFVNTNDPIIGGGIHGYFNLNYGNYNDAGFQGAVNLPLSDTFAARVALYASRRDTFYNITGPNGAPYPYDKGNVGIMAGRVSFLWKPTDRLSILWKTDAGHLDMGAYPATPFSNYFETLPGTSTPNPNHRDLFDVSFNAPQAARDEFVRSTLKAEYELAGGVKLRSVSSYQWANTMYRADLDGTATGISTFYDSVDEQQVTTELNLISPDTGRVTWLLGAFGLWNDYYFRKPYQFIIDTAYPFNLPAAQYKLQGTNPTRSLAAFGQIGFAITPRLKLDAGIRYTASQSTNHVDVLQYGTYIRQDQQVKSDNVSYKVSLGWKASDTQYLYGFVATGFRPGGLNVPVGLGNPAPFEPEEVTSYEAGWKANWAGGKVRTTITGFYNDYKNFQVIIGYPTFPTFGIELNVPNSTKIYGFEAEAEFHFGGLQLDAGVNVLKSELGTFYASDPRVAAVGACDPRTGSPTNAANCINLNGRRQTYAPNLTFNLGAQYELALGNGDKITPRANFGHVGDQWATLFQNSARGDHLEARNILNAQLAYQHKSWTVTLYGTNLTDQHYPAALNSGLYFAGPPRQYGIKLLKTF
ncbi:TonB-dependent receptor [Sphingomonas kyeonggiensis]|uniref:Iron complex outermembrane receptor protein n=1 Tax=Sphingomonas kyeonggiensis TaxID=1268553 RepID=A0A7W6JUP4_9SPHN|nr:TonB-dependent receptor [Sphingomonas kyeonggiensis]MBB4098765.1 iron complex outermembrane receptor protein [Sphingomonas kyeonggiensis]